MSPTIIENGREIPIAGYRAVGMRRDDRNFLLGAAECRDTAHCGHVHETPDEARECASVLCRVERMAYTKALNRGMGDGNWDIFRVEIVRELPEEHLE